jgi:hypothetical protein
MIIDALLPLNMPPSFQWSVRNCFSDHSTYFCPELMTSDNKHIFFPHNCIMRIKIGVTKKAGTSPAMFPPCVDLLPEKMGACISAF